MSGEASTLTAICFTSGLAAGLLGLLCTITRPMLEAMKGRDFRNFMETFSSTPATGWGYLVAFGSL